MLNVREQTVIEILDNSAFPLGRLMMNKEAYLHFDGNVNKHNCYYAEPNSSDIVEKSLIRFE